MGTSAILSDGRLAFACAYGSARLSRRFFKQEDRLKGTTALSCRIGVERRKAE